MVSRNPATSAKKPAGTTCLYAQSDYELTVLIIGESLFLKEV